MEQWFLIDFGVFMQAVKDLVAGLNPYAREGFFSPPWLFYLLFLFSIWPAQIGALAWVMVNFGTLLACLGLVAEKHRYRTLWIAGLALSPLTWSYALFANIVGWVGIGLVGLFTWRRSWLAVPLVLLKPQLAVVALVVWAFRSGWGHILKALGFLVALNLPLLIWRPTLYRDFVWKAVHGQYLETQSLHISAATSWLPFGSPIWIVSSLVLIVVLIGVSLWTRSKPVTFLSTMLADPLAAGGEYGLLAVGAAMGHIDGKNLAMVGVTVFILPLLSIFLPRGDLLLPLATATLLAWAVYSARRDKAVSVSPAGG